MTHRIISASCGWFLVSTLGNLLLDASLFDSYGEALDAWAQLAYGGGQ